MLIPGEFIVNFTFAMFIIIISFFYYNGILKTNLDYLLGIIAVIISVIIIFIKTELLMDFTHFMYCIYLILVSILSGNTYLLGLNVIMFFNIIISRHVYCGCLLAKQHKSHRSFSSISDFLDKHLFLWDWKYIYPALMLLSFIRLIYLSVFNTA
jgi:hypothetical protein